MHNYKFYINNYKLCNNIYNKMLKKYASSRRFDVTILISFAG